MQDIELNISANLTVAIRLHKNALTRTITHRRFVNVDVLLGDSIRLGENALTSLALTINCCAVNRAVGNGNLLSAIVTGLHENALSSTVIYTRVVDDECLSRGWFCELARS